jgi:hypothetical protein
MVNPSGGAKLNPYGWCTETIYPTRQRLFAYSRTLNLHEDVQWCTPPSVSTSMTRAAALAIEEHLLSSSRRCHLTLGSPPALNVFLGRFICHFFVAWVCSCLHSSNYHSRVGDPSTSIFFCGVAAVACIPVLTWPRWGPKCSLLRGSFADSPSFFPVLFSPFYCLHFDGQIFVREHFRSLVFKFSFLGSRLVPNLGTSW